MPVTQPWFRTAAATGELLARTRAGEDPIPLVAALRTAPRARVPWEHDPDASEVPMPLLEHAQRAIAVLDAIERGDLPALHPTAPVSRARFVELCEAFGRLDAAGVGPAVRFALVFADISKATGDWRREWLEWGVDLDVHNEASRALLATLGLRDALPELDAGAWELAERLVGFHGLAGQAVRGETPLVCLAEFAEWASEVWPSAFGSDPALAWEALHLVNVCDTAAVRRGLVDDALVAELRAVVDRVRTVAASSPGTGGISALLAEEDALEEGRLLRRLERLRLQAQRAGEPPERLQGVLDSAGEAWADWLRGALRSAQLWYAEPATRNLTPTSFLKVLAIGVQAGARGATDGAYHVSFESLVPSLGPEQSEARYRARVIDALLDQLPFDAIRRGELPDGPLGTVATTLGGDRAVRVTFEPSREAEALVTLLAIYERKSSAAFHNVLKLLCDLYGLRKDEFDRVANEADYLRTMNSSRSDKERMLDWVRPPRIVEVGPGGGVVLDLLAERFPLAEVIGLDVSEMVVASLRRRKATEGRPWEVVHGDAYELAEVVGAQGVDTVVFCSVLHEIFSYAEYEGPEVDSPSRFRLESVREILRAAFQALRPGGRIVIRDGIAPPAGVREIQFIDSDGPGVLELFVEEFEARRVEVEWVTSNRARMTTADSMEFLYCYTWGPASFPYEVREQYGIMTYPQYRRSVVEWLGPRARLVELPQSEASYLQPGYRTGLADKIELYDGDGQPVELPDSNMLLVIEKSVAHEEGIRSSTPSPNTS